LRATVSSSYVNSTGQPPAGFDPNTGGFGQPPPGYDPNQQQPFGAAPGAPLPPMTPQGGGNNRMKIILAAVGAVLLLVCIGGVAWGIMSFTGGGAADAKVGECLSGKSIDRSSENFQETDLEVVKCSDKDARYKVVGKVENKKQAEATNAVCSQFTGAEVIYWEGRKNEAGTVLCLKTNQ